VIILGDSLDQPWQKHTIVGNAKHVRAGAGLVSRQHAGDLARLVDMQGHRLRFAFAWQNGSTTVLTRAIGKWDWD
jgi:hypothetical protein